MKKSFCFIKIVLFSISAFPWFFKEINSDAIIVEISAFNIFMFGRCSWKLINNQIFFFHLLHLVSKRYKFIKQKISLDKQKQSFYSKDNFIFEINNSKA